MGPVVGNEGIFVVCVAYKGDDVQAISSLAGQAGWLHFYWSGGSK